MVNEVHIYSVPRKRKPPCHLKHKSRQGVLLLYDGKARESGWEGRGGPHLKGRGWSHNQDRGRSSGQGWSKFSLHRLGRLVFFPASIVAVDGETIL
jgi:hypothetical protein